MGDAAKARLARADDVDVFELPSDVDVTCSAPDDMTWAERAVQDEEIDSDDEQVVGKVEAKRIRKAKKAEKSREAQAKTHRAAIGSG